MKKVLIFALLASSGFGLSGCLKEVGSSPDPATPTRLTIRLEGVGAPATRALEAPGSTDAGTIELNSGYIFVLDASNNVIYGETLRQEAWIHRADPADDGEGQVLDREVPGNARVYVLGNIPGNTSPQDVTGLQNFEQIAEASALIATQGDYRKAALANRDLSPKAIEPSVDGAATVHVTLAPLISRLELHQLTGGDDIDSFQVSGVYVDDWFPSFTFVGTGIGTIFHQGQSTLFDTNSLKDEGLWPAAAAKVVAPGGSTVWAYNVASGNLPRLLVQLKNVTAKAGAVDSTGATVSSTATYYLTIRNYNGMSTPVFTPGVIYQVKDLSFKAVHLSPIPNPEDITLRLTVDIQEWRTEVVTGDLY